MLLVSQNGEFPVLKYKNCFSRLRGQIPPFGECLGLLFAEVSELRCFSFHDRPTAFIDKITVKE